MSRYTVKSVVFFTLWLLVLGVGTAQAAKLPDFTELVKKNSPAVVNISTTTEVSGQQGMPFSQHDLDKLPEFFRRFFGGPNGPGMPGGPEGPSERRSMGSGFIVSKDGYILTNNHVVDGADEVMVSLNDRRELEAEIVGTDPRSDLAVLKVNVDDGDLPVLKLGKSSELEVGEWVVAIGSPFGFDHTVTAGIVSGKGRALPSENYVPFIQTDVAINPGNSGGPLFDLDGEVVGINSQIFTRSGGYMGVSFAIPIDVAMNVFHQIRDQGHVTRGWLGVMIQEVNRDLAESFGLSKPHGALVAEVMPDSPAADADLKAGDIILEYNGHSIGLASELPPLVGRSAIGEEAELTVMRNGDEKEVTVKIGQLPEDETASAGPDQAPQVTGNRLGVVAEALPDKLRKEWDLDGGVLVTKVGNGPAAKAGIRPHDVIRSINNQQIASVDDFEEAVDELPSGKAVPVLIVRNGTPSFIVVKMPED
ncbi:DegQ family serine endoprotease [Marinobacteraceae bacterium S3BR75-40.1]